MEREVRNKKMISKMMLGMFIEIRLIVSKLIGGQNLLERILMIGKKFNKYVDAQFEIARRFYDHLLESEGGREKLRKLGRLR